MIFMNVVEVLVIVMLMIYGVIWSMMMMVVFVCI